MPKSPGREKPEHSLHQREQGNPRTGYFFDRSNLSPDDLSDVLPSHTKDDRQLFVPVAEFAWRFTVKRLKSLDGIGEVAAVVCEVPQDEW